jgi:hypothetical protein
MKGETDENIHRISDYGRLGMGTVTETYQYCQMFKFKACFI